MQTCILTFISHCNSLHIQLIIAFKCTFDTILNPNMSLCCTIPTGPGLWMRRELLKKIRDATQPRYLRVSELVEGAYIKCPVCQHCVDCRDVSWVNSLAMFLLLLDILNCSVVCVFPEYHLIISIQILRYSTRRKTSSADHLVLMGSL
jgi:hypothetical protein